MMNKLCYVLPEYNEKTDEHFLHTFNFLEKLGEQVDVSVIIEKSRGTPKLRNVKETYMQQLEFLPLRLIELLFILCFVRFKGYKKLYVHYSFMPAIFGSIIFRLTGGTVYYWNCGLAADYFLPWAFKPDNIKKKFDSEIPLRAALRFVNFLVTGTETMAKYYSDKFNLSRKKIIIVPNDITLSKYNAKRESHEGKTVLFVHRLSVRKGAHHIPSIAQGVISRISDARFTIVGGGPDRAATEAEIGRIGLSEKVKFVGAVPNSEIAGYFSLADVFIMPSDEEGFPRVLLESMAFGVPFVATDVGGVTDMTPKSEREFIVPKGDTERFINKLVYLLNNKERRIQLSADGKEAVKEFDTQQVIRTFINKIILQ